MKSLLSVLLAWLVLPVLVACAAPPPAAAPPAASPPASAATPVVIDRSCRSDADCTVKNVGNCCGAAPACVNVASATDPQAVKAQCQASGRMSICGFRQISGCQCVAGQCAANDAATDTLPRRLDTPQTQR